MESGLCAIAGCLPPRVARALEKVDDAFLSRLHEVRLRAERPVSLTLENENLFLLPAGRLSRFAAGCLCVTYDELLSCFNMICENSVHSHENEIAQGFVSLKNGARAGICGTAVYDSPGHMASMRDINSVCLRIPREVKGAAERFFSAVTEGGRVRGALLISPPKLGKTTILRDLARKLSAAGLRAVVVDERNEIAAVRDGRILNEIGVLTDVISGAPKSEGIMHAIRSLSPQVIICDEIGSAKETEKMTYAMNCGVPVIASCHGDSIERVRAREGFEKLFSSGAVEIAAVIGPEVGKINEITRVG